MKAVNKILFKQFKVHIWSLLIVVALIFIGVGFEALAPWPFKVLIDNVLGHEPLDSSSLSGQILGLFNSKEALGFFVVLVYGSSVMFTSIVDFWINVWLKRLGRNVILDFSRQAFDSLERLAIGFYKKQEIGDYIYRLSYDVSALGDLAEHGVVPFITNSLHLIVTVVIMFYIDARLAWVALAIVPVLVLSLGVFNKRLGIASKRSEVWNSALFTFIQEILNQLRIVQAFNQERRESAAFGQREEASLQGDYNVYGLGFALDLIIGLIVAIGYSIIVVYGIQAVSRGELSTGLLVAFIFYLDNLTNPLLALVTAVADFKEDYVKVSRMEEFFAKRFQAHDRGTNLQLDQFDIKFENVTVTSDQGLTILKDASFHIPAGKRTAIVGVNGSGKSTILSLILRFIEPSSGAITVGDKDIRSYSLRALRDAIAFVPQEIVLFSDTIKNNITFGENISPAALKRACKLADAERFIARMPGKFDFWVGEEGANLSGGQRQRLMLARAFAKEQSKLVLMDEPLSSLDVKTRLAVMDSINKFCVGKTSVIVSNVLEVINQADYVIVVNQGKIMHAGTGQRLLKESKIASIILNSA